MRKHSLLLTAASAAIAFGQPAPPAQTQGGGRGQTAPAVASISKRPTGASLGTIRVGASDNNIWFGWRVGIPTAAFRQLSWSEALAHADTLGVASVEVSSTQKTSPEVPKNFDYRLHSGERGAVNYRLRELNQQIGAYRVENLGSDAAAWKNTFDFAKTVNVQLMIVPEPSSLADLERRCGGFGRLDARRHQTRRWSGSGEGPADGGERGGSQRAWPQRT
jgi:hypothetical protein